MSSKLEYHIPVNRLVFRPIPASLALFGMFLFSFVAIGSAQFNASSSSSGGHAASSVSTAVTVIPHTGTVVPPTAPHNPGVAHVPHTHTGNPDHHPHTGNGTAGFYAYPYLYGAPYAADATDADSPADDDANYQGGPTIFDRRGSGAASYVSPTADSPDQPPAQDYAATEPADPAPDPVTPTTLVFKDGHQIEVDNYAIVSQTLYDLTPGHHRKIALADLDLAATQKQNDDNGIVFELPHTSQAN